MGVTFARAGTALVVTLTGGRRGDDPLPASSDHVVKAVIDLDRGPLSLSTRVSARSAARHPEQRTADDALVDRPRRRSVE